MANTTQVPRKQLLDLIFKSISDIMPWREIDPEKVQLIEVSPEEIEKIAKAACNLVARRINEYEIPVHEPISKLQKKKMPSVIDETGISVTFTDTILLPLMGCKNFDFETTRELMKEKMASHEWGLKSYGEHFAGYRNVINSDNKHRVQKLDNLVLSFKARIEEDKIDDLTHIELMSFLNEFRTLVEGEGKVYFPEIINKK